MEDNLNNKAMDISAIRNSIESLFNANQVESTVDKADAPSELRFTIFSDMAKASRTGDLEQAVTSVTQFLDIAPSQYLLIGPLIDLNLQSMAIIEQLTTVKAAVIFNDRISNDLDLFLNILLDLVEDVEPEENFYECFSVEKELFLVASITDRITSLFQGLAIRMKALIKEIISKEEHSEEMASVLEVLLKGFYLSYLPLMLAIKVG